MSDAWNDIQAIKNRQSDIRAKMLERRKLREGLAAELTSSGVAPSIAPANVASSSNSSGDHIVTRALIATNSTISTIKPFQRETVKVTSDPEVEKKLLMVLCDISLDIPSDSKVIAEHTSRLMEREVDLRLIEELLKKFASQKLITIKFTENTGSLIVNSLDLSKLSDITKGQTKKRKKDSDDEEDEEVTAKQARTNASESGDIESLLSMQSTKEREEKKLNEEIQALLVTQTAKEQYLVEKFKSRGGPQLQEFCQCGTREECQRSNPDGANCKRLHFKKIINIHTDESLGDCSFLNTCFHMDSCKEVTNDSNGMMHGPTQLQPQGTMNQNSTQDWFYSFENSENIYSTYGEHKRDILATRYFPQSSNANAGDHMMSGGFITQLSNVSNNAVRPYNSTSRDEEINAYPPSTVPSNCNGAMPLYPVAAVPEAGDVSDRSFPQPSLPVSGNISSQPYPDIIGTGPSITRHYSPMTMPDTASSSTQYSESYPHLQFQYSTVPYSITAAAPSAPAMSSVTADSSSELTPPAVSHTWTSANPVFPLSFVPSKTAESPHPLKLDKSKKSSAISNSTSENKKRSRQPDKWKKNLSKTKKIKGEEHLSRTGNIIPAKKVENVDCSQCTFRCNENFNFSLRQQLFDVFYSLGSNESQKQFVCQNVQEMLTKVSSTGKRDGKQENKRKVSRKYFLPDTDNTRKQVCSKFFCGTLAVGKTFISHALRHKQFGCYIGKEKRGKPHNKVPENLLEPARQHISTMLDVNVKGSKKNVKKKFLEQGLSITKMYEMFKEECSSKNVTPVSLSMYRRVFHKEF